MTFYVRHIFANNDPEVIAVLRADRRLNDHVFIIDSLESFERVESEPFAVMLGDGKDKPSETVYRDVVHRPAFPAGGLVIVREVAEPEGHAREWFGNDAPDAQLDAPGSVAIEPDESLEIDGVLRYCKSLAQRTGKTIAFFSADFWGGDCEDARAYVYEGPSETAYVRQDDTVVIARTSKAPGVARSIAGGDALTLCLLHFEVLLPLGYFLPHTRSFPWEEFRDG